jgi:hypothetical protein
VCWFCSMSTNSPYIVSNAQPRFTSCPCCDRPAAGHSLGQTSGALHGARLDPAQQQAFLPPQRSRPLLKTVHYPVQERLHMGIGNSPRNEAAAINSRGSELPIREGYTTRHVGCLAIGKTPDILQEERRWCFLLGFDAISVLICTVCTLAKSTNMCVGCACERSISGALS